MQVTDSAIRQQCCQLLRFGPRHVPRSWEAADIDEQFDSLVSKKADELLCLELGVPNH